MSDESMAAAPQDAAAPPAAQTVDAPPAAETAPAPKARPTDVVLHYVGGGAFVTTPWGTLPQRDITRAEAPALLHSTTWRDAVLASGAYTAVEGTRIVLPDPDAGPAGA